MFVDAARRLVREKGRGFTTQELVKEAGVALQTFYRHFPGKDELLLAVLEETVAEGCAGYRERARELPDPLSRLHFYITAAVSSVLDGDQESQQFTDRESHQFTTSEHYRLHQLFPEELAIADAPFTDLLIPEIREAQAAGLLAPHDVERDAWFVTQLVMAVYHHYAFATDPAGDVAEELWQFCLAALGGSPASEPKPKPAKKRTTATKRSTAKKRSTTKKGR